MSEEQGYIMERDGSAPEKAYFDNPEVYGNDRNQAGDAYAEGGYNKGDINIDIEQGGEAAARGGDAVTFEEYLAYKEYSEQQHKEYNEHEHKDYKENEEYDKQDVKECSDSTGSDAVF